MSEYIRNGQIGYRTRLLTEPRARSFAAAVAANPRFTLLGVEHSARAKGEAAYFVTFRPASEERQQDMAARQQASREERALAQGSEYVWCPDKNAGRAFFWCLSTSGEVYEVAPGHSCTCADFHYRCEGAGLQCKHLLAIEQGLGTIARFEPAVAPQPVRGDARNLAARAEVAELLGA